MKTTKDKSLFRRIVQPILTKLFPTAGIAGADEWTQSVLYKATDLFWDEVSRTERSGAELVGAQLETKKRNATRTIRTESGSYSAMLTKLVLDSLTFETRYGATLTVTLSNSEFRQWIVSGIRTAKDSVNEAIEKERAAKVPPSDEAILKVAADATEATLKSVFA